MSRRYTFERILEELRRSTSRREVYERLGISRQQLYNYLRLMRDKGMLDENYNIIYQRADYTDEKFISNEENLLLPETPFEHPKEGDAIGFGGKPFITLKNSPEYEEYARRRRSMTFEELYAEHFKGIN